MPVLVHIPETLFEARHLGTLIDRENLKRLVVIVNHAADSIHVLNRFLEDSQQLGIPLTLILEERKNQWEATNAAERSRLRPAEFILGALDSSEINEILDALQKHNALDKLTGVSRELQVNHFTALAEKELLVALRELTNDNSFDDIVTDEFRKIPSEKAQLAYVYVAMLGVVNLGIRYETLLNLLDVRADQLAREIFAPTEGVLITAEEVGNSRHTAGFTIRSVIRLSLL